MLSSLWELTEEVLSPFLVFTNYPPKEIVDNETQT